MNFNTERVKEGGRNVLKYLKRRPPSDADVRKSHSMLKHGCWQTQLLATRFWTIRVQYHYIVAIRSYISK